MCLLVSHQILRTLKQIRIQPHLISTGLRPTLICSHSRLETLYTVMLLPNGHDKRFTSSLHGKQRSNDMTWGIQAGRLPMYSPVWTNDKPWLLQKSTSALVAGLDGLRISAQRYLPSSSGRASRSLTSAPSSTASNITFVLLCGLWYTTSAISSNTGKAILNQFRYPITLTFVQFGFVAFYCLLFMSPLVRFSRLRMPTKIIVQSTFPMGLFQVGGHIFSSIAISRIPVSTVHTIKVGFDTLPVFACLLRDDRHYPLYSP